MKYRFIVNARLREKGMGVKATKYILGKRSYKTGIGEGQL
jgi:hypothetical protein